MVKLGMDGPARRSPVCRVRLVDRATANSLPRTAVGHKQDDQAAETSPPREAAREFSIRAWSLRGSAALKGTGRSNEPLRSSPGLLEGGLDDPKPLTPKQLASHRTPDPDVDALRFGRLVGRIRILVFHAKNSSP